MNEKIITYKKLINDEISKIHFSDKPKNLYEPLKYILSLKSKRLRPTLSILSYKLFQNEIDNIIIPSISLELFHNFTLIHDDIMDNADLRRGKITVHKKWNKNIGILSGDILMIYAYKLLEELSPKISGKIIKRFNEISIQVCEGQQYDMNYEEEDSIGEENYLEMIRLKTAVLIGFSLELGGLVAKCDKKTTKILYKIGEMMGIGFQLMDDYLDVFGNSDFGKKIGGDIVSNKKTYLMIKLLEKSDKDDLEKINEIKKSKDEKKKVNVISELMLKHKINRITKENINSYFEKALKQLDQIECNLDNKTLLKEYFEKIMVRVS
tara:strand:- start:505 stop:1473 length:969 start_codon:yes stop_codon:yes gene_type:complete